MRINLFGYILVIATLLLAPGCTSINPVTGEKTFDEGKTRALLVPLVPAMGYTVSVSAKADPNTRSAYVIAESVIANLLKEDSPVNRDEIQRRLDEVKVPAVAASTVLDYWDILVAYVFRSELTENPDQSARAARIVLEMIQDGINLGLQGVG